MPAPANAHFSRVSHSGGSYRYAQVPQCRVCASEHRAKIERLWSEGVPPATILRRLPTAHGISRQSVGRHARNHLPIDRRLVARRSLVRAERRWDEVGRECTIFAATEAEVQAMVMRMVLARIDRGELVIDTAAAIRAMELSWSWEADETEARRAQADAEVLAERYGRSLTRLFDAVLDVGGEEFAHKVVVHLRRSRQEEDPLELPCLEHAWRWHRGWINGDDRAAREARRSA